jgi:hypothetical protein
MSRAISLQQNPSRILIPGGRAQRTSTSQRPLRHRRIKVFPLNQAAARQSHSNGLSRSSTLSVKALGKLLTVSRPESITPRLDGDVNMDEPSLPTVPANDSDSTDTPPSTNMTLEQLGEPLLAERKLLSPRYAMHGTQHTPDDHRLHTDWLKRSFKLLGSYDIYNKAGLCAPFRHLFEAMLVVHDVPSNYVSQYELLLKSI